MSEVSSLFSASHHGHRLVFFDLGLAKHDRVKLIHYEALVQEPEMYMREITSFVGIEFEKRMVEGIFDTSVGKHDPPLLTTLIREECETTYRRLCDEFLGK